MSKDDCSKTDAYPQNQTVIYRLSHKLNSNVKAASLQSLPLADNPYVDWSCHVFNISRTQYIIFCNTDSLLSCLALRKGITSEQTLVARAMETIGAFLRELGHEQVFTQHIAPNANAVTFAKALNRSVTGSISELLVHAEYDLADGRPLHDVAKRLNAVPMSALASRGSRGYGYPGEAFAGLAANFNS